MMPFKEEKQAQEDVNPYVKNIAIAAAIGALLGAGGLSVSHLISGKETSEKEALIQNLKAAAKGALVGGGLMGLINQTELLNTLRQTITSSEGTAVPDFSVPRDRSVWT